MVDKQVILNSSPEFKEIENHLAITWDSLDQVGQSWVNDFQKKIKKEVPAIIVLSLKMK